MGMDSQRSAESLAGEAGSDQSGTEQSRRIEKINALGLQQSSAAEQGVANGTDTVKNRFFRPGDSEAVDKLIREDAQYAAVAALCKARGQNLILFTGLLEVNEGGKVILADGMQQGSDIYIRADGNEHTPLKIYEHEDTHDAIEAAGGENGALYQSMKEKLIRNLGGEQQFEALKAKYAEALPDGYSEYDIVQEMLADARGTMNDFKGNTKLKAELDEEVRQQVGERRTGSRGSGSRSSYVGQLSKTADTNMLSRAEQMEQQNIDAETIWQETGWFRGADGKWRYEIDDSRARVNLKGDARFRQEHPGYARYMELMDTMLYGELTSDEFKELRTLDREWSDVSQKLSASVRDGEARLGDVMEHDGLYEAYPDIADIEVSFEKMEAGNRGAYIPSQNRIVLNEELKNDPDALMNSLLHEVQHAIQQKEGFSEGASPFYWALRDNYDRAMEKYRGERDKILQGLDDADMRLYKEYREIVEKEKELLTNPTLELIDEMDELAEINDMVVQEIYGKEWFAKLDRLDKISDDLKTAVWTMYGNTAGEIEARDSANRRSMTAEERKNSPPDTGDELTVFAENGENAASIANTRNMTWEEQMRRKFDKKAKKLSSSDSLYLGESGDFAKADGVTNGPLYIPQSVITKAMRPEKGSRSGHELSQNDIENIKNAIETAPVVIVNPGRNAMIYVTAYQDKKGNNIIAAFDLNNNLYGEIAHKCTSIYGRESIESLIKSLPDNAAFYVKNTSDNAMSGNGILRSPKLLLPVESVMDTIAQATKDVKSKASAIGVDTDTETPAGTEIQRTQEQGQTSQEPLQDTGITDNRFTEALKKIGVNNITGSLVDYAGIEVEQQTARTAAEARRYLRRVLKETKADPRTQAFAHDVARGIYTMDDLPNTMSRGIVEELADAYRFAEGVVQDSLAYKRRQINAGLDADARKLFADSDNYNPAKFGRLSKTLMNERTPARVLRSIFGEQKGSEIYEAYWRPIIENNAAAKLWKNKQREDVKTFRDSKGTKKEERPLLFLMFGGKKFGGKNMNEIGNMKKQKPANH